MGRTGGAHTLEARGREPDMNAEMPIEQKIDGRPPKTRPLVPGTS